MALTAKQKKLPKALQKAILAKQKKEWQEEKRYEKEEETCP